MGAKLRQGVGDKITRPISYLYILLVMSTCCSQMRTQALLESYDY